MGLLAWLPAAQAQSSNIGFENLAPIYGSTIGMSPPRQSGPTGGFLNAQPQRHRGPTGKPCLAMSAYTRPHSSQSNLFDHMVVSNNSCGKPIKIQICYYMTKQCVQAEIPAWKRVDTLLGIVPAQKEFRYEFREKMT